MGKVKKEKNKKFLKLHSLNQLIIGIILAVIVVILCVFVKPLVDGALLSIIPGLFAISLIICAFVEAPKDKMVSNIDDDHYCGC